MADTIFALSSGAVPSGVAVIRVSGPRTREIVECLCGRLPEPRKAMLSRLAHPQTGDVLDEALVLYFEGPASFTGEDVAEFQCHGGRAVVAGLLSVLSGFNDCRPAEAGEFTRRAFDRGRMDLTEVEGLADLIAAETESQRRQALRQMGGALGTLYENWRKRLIHMRAMIEADFDFADEEDVPGSVADEVWKEASGLHGEIADHLVRSKSGERLRSGLQVVLMGAPNAGKSSLLNAIAGRDVAIVTEEAGTTRDVIEVHLDLGGYPVTLVDTAGLRQTDGIVEREGIRRAEEKGRSADLILWAVEPDGVELNDPAAGLPEDLRSHVPVWTVRTKSDLETLPEQDSSGTIQEIACSSKSADGMTPLFTRLTRFAEETISLGEAPLATRERHRHYLTECLAGLRTAVESEHLPGELRAEDLRRAADALGRITGRIDVEDLLDVIFRDFCIGK
ncbi:tRNA uridine-5-carboxymethylaminomethyl(34) synthesis GTPase MnmE [Labrenzia sp. VG12]|uniref:tRNA uridine-5-carboxymethylaminomethyl(34) synthesis GTPase MnmE n=1 Tax=Labrenzia sp. VG12 TaxID=2021862 RepID=UPI000B8C30E5|nr:tRNA uridine-5-carboxymethylaminomethyl(34) synthesis GTPase MnmE [Labrenzia sp. VG12]ASP35160.1 tRNA uridine-5-carboxymethylaminomethyl(34) synthesis GTPase MnmE [Labrenzia sp. VG12]